MHNLRFLVSLGPEYHRGLLYLAGIFTLNNQHHVKLAQRCIATHPDELWALLYDLQSYIFRPDQELVCSGRRLKREPNEDNPRCHGPMTPF